MGEFYEDKICSYLMAFFEKGDMLILSKFLKRNMLKFYMFHSYNKNIYEKDIRRRWDITNTKKYSLNVLVNAKHVY